MQADAGGLPPYRGWAVCFTPIIKFNPHGNSIKGRPRRIQWRLRDGVTGINTVSGIAAAFENVTV